MLAFEHSLTHRDSLFQQSYSLDSDNQHSFDMDPYNHYNNDMPPAFAPLPYPYYENAAMFAPIQDLKPQMTRSTSSSSSMQHFPGHPSEYAPGLMSSASNASIPSASSSTVGSPYSGPMHMVSQPDSFNGDAYASHGLGLMPTIVGQEAYQQDFSIAEYGSDLPIGQDKISGHFVDPALISGPRSFGDMQFAEQPMYTQQPYSHMSPGGSPAPSPSHFSSYTTQFSQPMTNDNFMHQQHYMARRPSVVSSYMSSGASHASPASEFNEDVEKGKCHYPECGKVFKDLKAHMLTHQAERPEKCPIQTCEYNLKGFARKYDKNRHTLTHYKGTMVCGFCPGSGSAAEKSFNRADVFKRHLTSVHGVEQTPPNSRKRSPTSSSKKLSSYCHDATGKCSTCSQTFNNAQDFYEHLDDCVLRVVQMEEPSEAINAQHLGAINNDKAVQETFDRHMIKTEENPTSFDEEEEEEEEDDEDDEELYGRSGRSGVRKAAGTGRVVLSGAVSKSTKPNKKGVTWSKGGVALVGKGRKKRKHYPPSWGMAADKMQMKKRVLTVFDGSRRLWKDDMMLHNEFEVRMPLPDGKSYVTDLDVETMKRAEAFHNATDAERGPWSQDLGPQLDLEGLMS